MLPGQEQWRWDAAGNPLEGAGEKIAHNRVTQLNGIRWRYDIHGRAVEKDNGQIRHYRYDGEHRLGQAVAGERDAGIRIFSEPADAGAIPGP